MLILLLFYLISHVNCSSLVDQVYVELAQERTVCFRLLNGTHQFGCQSGKSGEYGVVVDISSIEEVMNLQKNCWSERFPDFTNPNYAVVVPVTLLYKKLPSGDSVFSVLRTSDCVSLVLLILSKEKEELEDSNPMSDDQICPNRHSSLYSSNCGKWNRKGVISEEGNLFTDWPKPVVILRNETNVNLIRKCHQTFNVPSDSATAVYTPYCALSIKAFSYAAGSAKLCMERSQGATLELDHPVNMCDPLQDYNVFSVIPEKAAEKGAKWNETSSRYLVLGTRMDSLSWVAEHSPGEISTLTSVIAQIAAAKAVSSKRKLFENAAKKSGRRLLFSFFHGEAFDYIGSGRFVHDVKQKSFPAQNDKTKTSQKELITMESIDAFVEVQQIGHSTGNSFFGHTQLVDGRVHPLISDFNNYAVEAAEGNVFSLESGPALPPSSAYSLLRENGSLPVMLITQFKEEYTYPRLNSMLDENDYSSGKTKDAIISAARILANVARHYVGVEELLEIDSAFVDQLMMCFFESSDWWTCSLFDAVLEPVKQMKTHKQEKNTYIGADGASLVRNVVSGLLVHATGSFNNTTNVETKEQCDDLNEKQTLYSYFWQREADTNVSHCLQTTVFLTKALSVAFLEDLDLTNTTHSTWVEATYSQSRDVKGLKSGPVLFLIGDSSLEWTTLVVGMITAFLALFFISALKEETFVFDEGEVMAEAGEPL